VPSTTAAGQPRTIPPHPAQLLAASQRSPAPFQRLQGVPALRAKETAKTATFDPVAYRDTTRAQWEEAAAAWHAWGPTLETWLAQAISLMLDAAVHPHRQRRSRRRRRRRWPIARRRPPSRPLRHRAGHLHLPTILQYAAVAAADAGITTLHTRELDGEQLDIEPAAFDAVISRLGLMYFPDQPRALAGIYKALRAGGCIAAVVFSTPDRNGVFFSIPVSIARGRAQIPPPAPGQPGPFSLGDPAAGDPG
jgi:hypothetical protein